MCKLRLQERSCHVFTPQGLPLKGKNIRQHPDAFQKNVLQRGRRIIMQPNKQENQKYFKPQQQGRARVCFSAWLCIWVKRHKSKNALIKTKTTKQTPIKVDVNTCLPAGGCPALSRRASFAPDLESCCTILWKVSAAQRRSAANCCERPLACFYAQTRRSDLQKLQETTDTPIISSFLCLPLFKNKQMLKLFKKKWNQK